MLAQEAPFSRTGETFFPGLPFSLTAILVL
jgi:hypothetical protein